MSGTILVKGCEAQLRSPRRALSLGIALISESRQDEGLFPGHAGGGQHQRGFGYARVLWSPYVRILSHRKERALTQEAGRAVEIASNALQRLIRLLSGGNQQKALLARWMMRRCEILVMIEPTRGVDVGARLEIYRQIERLAAGGTAVVVVSTDVPEVMSLPRAW